MVIAWLYGVEKLRTEATDILSNVVMTISNVVIVLLPGWQLHLAHGTRIGMKWTHCLLVFYQAVKKNKEDILGFILKIFEGSKIWVFIHTQIVHHWSTHIEHRQFFLPDRVSGAGDQSISVHISWKLPDTLDTTAGNEVSPCVFYTPARLYTRYHNPGRSRRASWRRWSVNACQN